MCIGAFNLWRQQSLFVNIHGDKQIHVWASWKENIKCCQFFVCVNQFGYQLVTEFDGRFWWEWCKAKQLIRHFSWKVINKRSCSVTHGCSFLPLKRKLRLPRSFCHGYLNYFSLNEKGENEKTQKNGIKWNFKLGADSVCPMGRAFFMPSRRQYEVTLQL